MTTQHTPTPFCTMYGATTVRGFDGTDVAINVKPDDCRFIVRACNAHDELVAALAQIVRLSAEGEVSARMQYALGDIARAALAKVTA